MNYLEKKLWEEFVGLRTKTYSYLIDDSSEHKKAKGKNLYHKKKTYL